MFSFHHFRRRGGRRRRREGPAEGQPHEGHPGRLQAEAAARRRIQGESGEKSNLWTEAHALMGELTRQALIIVQVGLPLARPPRKRPILEACHLSHVGLKRSHKVVNICSYTEL